MASDPPAGLRAVDDSKRKYAMKCGIAFASEEFVHGICGLAAPIVVGTRLRGALNVARPIARFTADIETSVNLGRPRLRGGHRAFRNREPIYAAISRSL
jgi:hypothetical protein